MRRTPARGSICMPAACAGTPAVLRRCWCFLVLRLARSRLGAIREHGGADHAGKEALGGTLEPRFELERLADAFDPRVELRHACAVSPAVLRRLDREVGTRT